jgi:hypothetical protein
LRDAIHKSVRLLFLPPPKSQDRAGFGLSLDELMAELAVPQQPVPNGARAPHNDIDGLLADLMTLDNRQANHQQLDRNGVNLAEVLVVENPNPEREIAHGEEVHPALRRNEEPTPGFQLQVKPMVD